MNYARSLVSLVLLAPLAALAACTATVENVAPPAPNNAGSDAGLVTQHGTIVDFVTKNPIAGATVSAAGESVTTDANGAYAFSIAPDKPYTVSVTAPGYGKLVLQERTIEADEDDGEMNLVSTSEATAVEALLPGYDATLGGLSVQVVPTGSCASAEGATISVSPAGAAKIAYFAGGVPSATQTSVSAVQFPSAVVYDVQPGVPLTLTVAHSTCAQVAFPAVEGAIRYTGAGIEAQPSGVTGFAEVFLK
jgi:hypothetical protein